MYISIFVLSMSVRVQDASGSPGRFVGNVLAVDGDTLLESDIMYSITDCELALQFIDKSIPVSNTAFSITMLYCHSPATHFPNLIQLGSLCSPTIPDPLLYQAIYNRRSGHNELALALSTPT